MFKVGRSLSPLTVPFWEFRYSFCLAMSLKNCESERFLVVESTMFGSLSNFDIEKAHAEKRESYIDGHENGDRYSRIFQANKIWVFTF